MADSAPFVPAGVFPFPSLPFELRDKIYRYAAIKCDGYIGEADPNGVECGLDNEANSTTWDCPLASKLDFAVSFHFPSGCRHPIHEKEQLGKDFRDYRCANLALTCSWIYEEVTNIFFKENGFELRDVHSMFMFFATIGMHRVQQIPRLRLYRNIELDIDLYETMFERNGVDTRALYQTLEQEHLNDDEPGSLLVRMMAFLKACFNFQKFDLVYRFEVPGGCFDVVRAGLVSWSGETFKWDMQIDNFFEKLRQDVGEGTDQIFHIDSDIKTDSFAKAVAQATDLRDLHGLIAHIVRRACVAHAENCIENSSVGGNRIGYDYYF